MRDPVLFAIPFFVLLLILSHDPLVRQIQEIRDPLVLQIQLPDTFRAAEFRGGNRNLL